MSQRYQARLHEKQSGLAGQASPLLTATTTEPTRELPIYRPSDFVYDAEARTCVCPAGKALYRKGQPVKKGLLADQYQGAKRDCVPCAQRAQCLRTPATTPVRQVAFFHGRDPAAPPTHTAQMKERIDSPEGRAQYAERFSEPSSRYSGTSAITKASIVSRSAAARRSRAVEALLPRAEHREARASPVRRVADWFRGHRSRGRRLRAPHDLRATLYVEL